MTEVPHFRLPFTLQGASAPVVEQDGIDDVAQCVAVVVGTPFGSMPDLPEFGSPDLAFSTRPVDGASLASAVAEWEPRAQVTVRETGGDTFVSEVEVAVARIGGEQ